jgi:hypothetical protein
MTMSVLWNTENSNGHDSRTMNTNVGEYTFGWQILFMKPMDWDLYGYALGGSTFENHLGRYLPDWVRIH